MTHLHPCRTRKAPIQGWEAYYLENELIRLAAVPDIGGRIMAYDLGPYPYVYVERALAGKLFTTEENFGKGRLSDWKNYGGDKTWPSPQGWDSAEQWHGPPDPVLDTGRYKVSKIGGDENQIVIQMVSPPDKERTGLQITRQFRLRKGTSRVSVDLKFTNVIDRPIRWSFWDVIQLRAERLRPDGTLAGFEAECYVTTPLNPDSQFDRGFWVMFGDEDNPQWQTKDGLFIAPYLWEIGKVGVDSTAGWIAFCNAAEGYAFIECFDVDPEGVYPDQGATVECWTVGAGAVETLNYSESEIYLMETEVLSTLRSLSPGQSSSFSIEWGACRCAGPVIDVTDAGCCTEPLTVDRQNDYAKLKGQFGVFDIGQLYLQLLNIWDQVIERANLGPVTPLAVVTMDQVVAVPEEVVRVELLVDTEFDHRNYLLAKAKVE